MKRILITSTDLMMIQFLLPHVKNLSEKGYEVELACSEVGGRLDEIREKIGQYAKTIHEVRLHRSPLSPTNFQGYKDMKVIMENAHYDIIWTNEPVMGVVTRLCAKKLRRNGTKVLYMVHGFHFYTGAPLLNWMIYYPIEKLMAHHANMIVTVNTEDYQRAKEFEVSEVKYIHGIGINTDRLTLGTQRGDIRKELGLKDTDFIVLSVGELNKNKNQQAIIKAIAKVNDPKIHYLMCGKGNQYDNLVNLVHNLRLDNNIHFLGYRRDVVDICSQADVYVMPSFREGLPVSSLEAMYCGLPLLTSNIRGLVDINKDDKNGYLYAPTDVDGFAEGIKKLKSDSNKRAKMGQLNRQEVVPFTIERTKKEIVDIIEGLCK